MARAILSTLGRLSAAYSVLLAFALCPAVAAGLPCAQQAPGTALLTSARQSPLFAMLEQRLGPPIGCQVVRGEDTNEVVLGFTDGGGFTLSVSEIIETSSQEAVVPVAAVPLTRTAAVKVLRAVERSSVQPGGCGIVWSKLSDAKSPTSGNIVAQGKVCNCRAHVQTEHDAVVGLGFSVAC